MTGVTGNVPVGNSIPVHKLQTLLTREERIPKN